MLRKFITVLFYLRNLSHSSYQQFAQKSFRMAEKEEKDTPEVAEAATVQYDLAELDESKKEDMVVQAEENEPQLQQKEMEKPDPRQGSHSPSNGCGEEADKRSHTSSKLSKYIRHNGPNRSSHQIEPVLGAVNLPMFNTDVEIANQNANAQITINDGGEAGKYQAFRLHESKQIQGVSQSSPPSQLQQSSLEQLAKKSIDIMANEKLIAMDYSNSQPVAQRMNQDIPSGLIAPITLTNQQQSPAIISQQLVEQIVNQQDVHHLVMAQLNPSLQHKILSPPAELLMHSETKKLLELYQLQTLELMRMTEQSSPTPNQQFQAAITPSSDTMEQAQQVAMPEIPGIGLNELYETMRMPQSGGRTKLLAHESVPTVGPNARGMQIVPGGKHPMLRIEQQSEVKPNGFMDFSGFSNRTISAPDIERYQMMDPSHSNPDCSYQKITMPAFYINQQIHTASDVPPETSKDGRKTGTFRDLPSHESSKKNTKIPAFQTMKPQVFLGMVDSEDNFRARYQVSPINQQHLSLPPKPDKSQHYRLVQMPQPQKPQLIEKNFVGGGLNISKYGGPSTKTARNNQMRSPLAFTSIGNQQQSTQPTFPAFFTKNAKNQQMKTTKQFERVQITKTDASKFKTQMKEEELMRQKPIMKGNEGRQTQKDFRKHGSGLVVDPSVFIDKRKSVDNSGSPGKGCGGVTKKKGEILRYSVHVAPQFADLSQQSTRDNNCRPILFQSSCLAPSIDESRTAVFIDKQSPSGTV